MMSRVPIVGPQDRFCSLEAVCGESYSSEVVIFNSDGVSPVDLSGYVLTFYLWEGALSRAVKVCEVVPADGIVKLSLSSAESAALSPVAHHFELWADNGEGQVKLIIWGYFWLRGACLS